MAYRPIIDPFRQHQIREEQINRAIRRNEYVPLTPDEKDFDDPRFLGRINISTRDYENMINTAKEYYIGAEDPNSYATRLSLGHMLGNYYNIDPNIAAENAEYLYELATGYESNVDGIGEHLANTFRSNGSSLLASARTLLFYLSHLGVDNEQYAKDFEEFNKNVLGKYKKNYRTDLYLEDEGLLADIFTAAAALAPSMLPTIATHGIFTIAGALKGVKLASGVVNLFRNGSTMSKTARILSGVDMATSMAITGALEAGGSILSLSEMGFDKDVILPVAITVGTVNGLIEQLNIAENTILRPFDDIVSALGRKKANRIYSKALHKVFTERLGEYVKSLVSEPTEEVLQEFMGMWGQNIAIEMQNERNRPVRDQNGELLTKYTGKDFANAALEVALETLKGTAVIGGGGLLLGTGSSRLFGQLKYNHDANSVTTEESATGKRADSIISTKNINFKTDLGIKEEKLEKGVKAPAIEFAKIGSYYFPINPSGQQMYAMKHSKHVYGTLTSYSPDWANNTTNVAAGKISRNSIDEVLETTFRKGDLLGYAYVIPDVANGWKEINSPISSISPVYLAVESRDVDGISLFEIAVNESDATINSDELLKTAFGADYDPVDVQATNNTTQTHNDTTTSAQTDSSNSTIDNSTASDDNITGTQQDVANDVDNNAVDLERNAESARNTANEILEENPPLEPIVQPSQQNDSNVIDSESEAKTDRTVENNTDSSDELTVGKSKERSAVLKEELEQKDREAANVFGNKIRKSLKLTPWKRRKAVADAIVDATVFITNRFAEIQGKSFADFVSGISDIQPVETNTKLGGIYKPVEKIIMITRHATPTTMIHEIGHYFLDTLQDGEVKDVIIKVYKKQYEKDGNKIGSSVQEAFSKDLERYCSTGKSTSYGLRNVMEKLYNLARELWNGDFTFGKSNLSPDKMALFDYMFGVESESKQNIEAIEKALEEKSNKYKANEDKAQKAKTFTEKNLAELEKKNKEKQEARIKKYKETSVKNSEAGKIGNYDKQKADKIQKDKEARAKAVVNAVSKEAKEEAQETMEFTNDGYAPYSIEDLNGRLMTSSNLLVETKAEKLDWPEGKTIGDVKIEYVKTKSYVKTTPEIDADLKDELRSAIFVNAIEGVPIDLEYAIDNLGLSTDDNSGYLNAVNLLTGLNLRSQIRFFKDKFGNIYVRMTRGIGQDAEGKPITYPFIGKRAYWVYIPSTEDYSGNTDFLSAREEYDYQNKNTKDVFVKIGENRQLAPTASLDPLVVANVFLKNLSTIHGFYLTNQNSDSSGSGVLADSINSEGISDQEASMYASVVVGLINSNDIKRILNAYDSAKNKIQTLDERADSNYESWLKEKFPKTYDKKIKDNPEYKQKFKNELAREMFGFDSYNSMKIGGLSDFILANDEKISGMLKGFKENAKRKIADNIAETLLYASESYSYTAKRLSRMNYTNAYNAISELFLKARNNSANKNTFDAKLRMLFNHKNKKFISDVMTALKGGGTIKAGQFDSVVRLFIDRNGDLVNVVENGGQLESPLIFLLDYVHSPMKTEDHFEGNKPYVYASQMLLKDTYTYKLEDTNTSMNLVDLITKLQVTLGDGVLAEFYQGYTSGDLSDMIMDEIDRITSNDTEARRINAELKQVRKELEEENKKLEAEKKEQQRQFKEDVEKVRKEAKSDAQEKIDEIRKRFEEKQKEADEKYLKKYEQLARKDADLRDELARWEAYIQNIANNPKLKLVNKLRADRTKYIENLKNSFNTGDARAASMGRAIVEKLSEKAKNGLVASPNLFISSWKDYDLTPFRKFAENYLGLREENGLLITDRTLNQLDFVELGAFEDVCRRFKESADARRKRLEEEQKQKVDGYIRSLVRSVLSNGSDMSDSEIDSVLDDIRSRKRPGSNIDQDLSKSGRFNIREAEILYNLARRLSPETCDFLFLGLVNGERSVDSLNTMNDNELRATQARVESFHSKVAELFGVDKSEVRSMVNELFADKTVKLGEMSLAEFMRKNNIDWGKVTKNKHSYNIEVNEKLPPVLVPLAKKILEQEEIRMKKRDRAVQNRKEAYGRLIKYSRSTFHDSQIGNKGRSAYEFNKDFYESLEKLDSEVPQLKGSDDSVNYKNQIIQAVKGNEINEYEATVLGMLFALIPESTRNKIAEQNGGELFKAGSSVEEINESLERNLARGVSDIKRSIIYLSEAADGSTVYHEGTHILLHTNPELMVQGRDEFKKAISSPSGLRRLKKHLREFQPIVGMNADDAINILDNLSDNWTTEEEELVVRIGETHRMASNNSNLPQGLKEFFDRIGDMIRRVYFTVTGRTDVPSNLADYYDRMWFTEATTSDFINRADGHNVMLYQGSANPVEMRFETPKDDYDYTILTNEARNVLRYQSIGRIGAQALDDWGRKNGVDVFNMLNLETAVIMHKDGLSMQEIKNVTGWEMLADNKWRMDIADNSDNINWDLISDYNFTSASLRDVYNNPELYTAYPDLANVEVVLKKFYDPGLYGSFNGYSEIEINKDLVSYEENRQELAKTLMHEIQHWIQLKERFAKGGSTELGEDIAKLADDELNNIFNKRNDVIVYLRHLAKNKRNIMFSENDFNHAYDLAIKDHWFEYEESMDNEEIASKYIEYLKKDVDENLMNIRKTGYLKNTYAEDLISYFDDLERSSTIEELDDIISILDLKESENIKRAIPSFLLSKISLLEDYADSDAFDIYQRLLGEIEARATSNKMDVPVDVLRKILSSYYFDVPEGSEILVDYDYNIKGINDDFNLDDEELEFENADNLRFQVMNDYNPERIGKGYKLFEQDTRTGKIYPLFIGTKKETEVGKWLIAEDIPTKNFARRPGWHIGSSVPDATWLKGYNPESPQGVYNSKRGRNNKNNPWRRVWAEVSYPMDHDWNDDLKEMGVNQLTHIPKDGYYLFREASGLWVIAGGIRIDRLLTEDDRQQIFKEAGYDEQKAWEESKDYNQRYNQYWNGRYNDAIKAGDNDTAMQILVDMANRWGYPTDNINLIEYNEKGEIRTPSNRFPKPKQPKKKSAKKSKGYVELRYQDSINRNTINRGWGLYFSEGESVSNKLRETYRVELPDDGYLEWNQSIPDYILNTLRDQILKEDLDIEIPEEAFDGNWNGRTLYNFLKESFKYDENSNMDDKSASLLLNRIGIKGIKYPNNQGYDYVIFNADDIKIKNNSLLQSENDINAQMLDSWENDIYDYDRFMTVKKGNDESWTSPTRSLATDAEYSMQKLMGIYEMMKQEDAVDSILQSGDRLGLGNNIPLENILWVIDQFTNNKEYENYRKLGDWMQNDMLSKYPELAEKYYIHNNDVLEQKDFYSRIYRLNDDLSDSMEMTLNTAFGNADSGSRKIGSVDRSVTYKRDPNAIRPLSLDYVNNYLRAIGEQEHYIAYIDMMEAYKKIFSNTSDFAEALRAESGMSEKGTAAVFSRIQRALTLIAEGNTYKRELPLKILDKLRNNMTQGVLWGNLSVALQNLPGYLTTLSDMSVGSSYNYLIEFLKNYPEIKEVIFRLAPQMKERAREEIYTAKSTRYGSKSEIEKKIDAFLEERYDNKDITNDLKRGYYKFIDAGMSVVTKSEDFIAMAMWWAYYQNNRNIKFKHMEGDANFDLVCAEDATQQVMNFFPSQNIKDTSLLYSNKDTGLRSMLLFTSQLNKIYNMLYGSASDFWNDRNFESFKKLMRNWGVGVAVIVSTAAISGTYIDGDDDDEDKSFIESVGNFIKSTVAEFASLIPAVGTMVKDYINGDVFLEHNILTSTGNLMKVLFKDENDRREDQLLRAWVREVSQIFQLVGLPSGLMLKIGNAIMEKDPLELVSSKWGNADFFGWNE